MDDGGAESAIFTVTVGAVDPDNMTFWQRVDQFVNLDMWSKGASDWRMQFINAFFVDGSLEDQKRASLSDWIFHFVSLFWRIFFSLVPPTSFCGGWLCFCACLFFIAAITAVIADLAELFGCVLEVPDIVTAITFVALGTSMPDLFASKMAAIEDPTADASIVNVTGSNSVNVFLGLGLPWSIAAIYWRVSPWSDRCAAKYKDRVDTENVDFM